MQNLWKITLFYGILLLQDFWFRHFCFLNMGRHYFNLNYDTSAPCNNELVPIQLVYSGDVLNGFVWQHVSILIYRIELYQCIFFWFRWPKFLEIAGKVLIAMPLVWSLTGHQAVSVKLLIMEKVLQLCTHIWEITKLCALMIGICIEIPN